MTAFLASRRRPLFGAVVAFALLAIAASLYATGGAAARHLAIVMVINAIMVTGTQIFVGNTGILSFGHVGLAGVAAYVTAILSTPAAIKETTIGDAPFGLASIQVPVPVAILVAVAFTTIIAALIGLFMSRLQGIAASIVTFAILIVANSVLINWKSLTGGSEAFYGIQVKTSLPWALGALFVAVVVARLFMSTRIGLRTRAAREDEVAAAGMGISVNRTRFVSWVLSAVFVSLGGALLAHLLGAISPGEFYENLMFLQIAMLVLGGMFSVTGALVGTVVVTVASEILRYFGDGPTIGGLKLPMIVGLSSMAYGVVILIVVVWWPGGILGDREIDGLWDWVARWRGRKNARAVVESPEAEQTAWPEPAAAPAVAAQPAAAAAATAGPVNPHADAAGQGTGAAPAQPAGVPQLRSTEAEPAQPPDAPAHPAGVPPVLSVQGVTMQFAGLKAVSDVSLTVHPGEIVGLIGPNGAGKTTLLNMISGYYKPTGGQIVLNGGAVTGLPSHRIARLGVGRTFQSTHLFRGLTVFENVEVAARVARQYRPSAYRPAAEILSQFGLMEVSRRKASTLPFGVQRQVEVARAVALGPDLLLLDEPAAGTNDVESRELVDSIRRIRDLERCAILLIDHDLPFVLGLCERVYVLDAGRVIAEGSPEQVQEDQAVREAYLGSRTVVVHHDG